MGEKLLAQRMLLALRHSVGSGGKAAAATLEWAVDQCDWLWPDTEFPHPETGGVGEVLRWTALARLADAIDTDEPRPGVLRAADAVARLLELDDFEARLLEAAVGFARLPRIAGLRARLAAAGENFALLAARIAGADAADAAERARRSAPVRLDLVALQADGSGGLDLILPWRFANALGECLADEDRVVETLAGVRQQAQLGLDDFAEHREAADLIVRLLRGAIATKAKGINILIHGPPGTGKTELARTLAAAAGAALYAVCEADDDGEEPTRWERLHALRRAQRLLARRGDSLLLFDEMEDLFADATMTAGGGRRAGSKVFVNRLFEDNAVATI